MAISNAVLATTLPKLLKDVVQESFVATPLFRALKPELFEGGSRLEQPLAFGRSTQMTESTGAGFNPLDTSVRDPMATAAFDFALFTQDVVISDQWRYSNAGDTAIASILDTLVENSLMNMRQDISNRIFRSTLPTSASSTLLQTLNGSGVNGAEAIDTSGWYETLAYGTGGQDNSVGGLSKSTYADLGWNNQYVNAGGTLTLASLNKLLNETYAKSPTMGYPDVIFMSLNCFSAFQALVNSGNAYATRNERTDLLGSFLYDYNGAKIYLEPSLGYATRESGNPVVSAIAMNSRYVKLYMDKSANFSTSELFHDPSVAAMRMRISLRLQLVTSHLASAGILANAEA